MSAAAEPDNQSQISNGSSLKDESISPRWQKGSGNADDFDLLLWVGVSRNHTLLAFHGTQDSKISKIADRLQKKPPKTGWDYYTYAVQSQKRLVHAVKFHIYQRHIFPVGKRVKLKGLVHNTFLNNTAVRILDYDKDQDKYLIRPTIPLPDDQKLSSTGQLLVKAQHLSDPTWTEEFHVWSFCAIFDGKKLKEPDICTFVEKLVLLSQEMRDDSNNNNNNSAPSNNTNNVWLTGGRMSAQTMFGPIIKAQMELFCSMGEDAYHDHSLDLSNEIVARNLFLLSQGSEIKSPAEKLRESHDDIIDIHADASDSIASVHSASDDHHHPNNEQK